MPSVTLHLAIAERTLAVWRPRKRPFDCADAAARNAFFQGAFGPDFGYFPGCWRPLSDLSHCLSTGDLTRALVARARTPIERAFAYGWLTHVLADQAIHPLIGCGVGELLHGRPDVFVDGDSDPASHVRVEAGLDALWAARWPELRRSAPGPVFDERGVGFIADAYEDTYGLRIPERVLLKNHRLAATRAGQGLHLAAWTARTWGIGGREPAALRLDGTARGIPARVRRALGHASTALAFLLPVEPPAWLSAAANDVAGSLPRLFMEEVESSLSGVANWNLDTGRAETADPFHGGRARARAALERLGSVPPVEVVREAA